MELATLVYRPMFYLIGIGQYCLRICTDTDIWKNITLEEKKRMRNFKKDELRIAHTFFTFKVYHNLTFDLQFLKLTNIFFHILYVYIVCKLPRTEPQSIMINASLMHIIFSPPLCWYRQWHPIWSVLIAVSTDIIFPQWSNSTKDLQFSAMMAG